MARRVLAFDAEQRDTPTACFVHYEVEDLRMMAKVLFIQGETLLDIRLQIPVRVASRSQVAVLDSSFLEAIGEGRLAELSTSGQGQFANVEHP